VDDHKAHYPGSHRITMRFTGDRTTVRRLGVQLFGHRHAEIAKRVDIAARGQLVARHQSWPTRQSSKRQVPSWPAHILNRRHMWA
jgi:hypothetical protein